MPKIYNYKRTKKNSINFLILFLFNISTYSKFIISEILIPFIQELNGLSIG